MRKISRENILTFFVLLLIFGIFQLSASRIYGFSLYPDEFGYWASAASAVGYNWSKLASLGSYYSFGYSVLLVPILWLLRGGVQAYRAAIAVNYLLVGGGFLLLLQIAKRIFAQERDGIRNVFFCAIAAFYPPWILYAQMTMAESLLTFLFILLSFLLVEFLKRPGVGKLALLLLTAVYLYSVHLRTIGVLLAAALVLVLYGLTNKQHRKYLLICAVTLLVAFLAFLAARRWVIQSVFTYATAEELAVNSYGSQSWKLQDILSTSGFRDFIVEILGKFSYFVIATGGLAVFAFSGTIRRLPFLFKRAEGEPEWAGAYFRLFLFLSAFAELLISSIYMHGSDRADSLLYGRYEEFVSPMLIAAGLYEMDALLKGHRGLRVIVAAIETAAGVLLLTPFFIRYLERKKYYRMRGFFVSGIGYLTAYNDYRPDTFMWRAAAVGVCLIFAVLLTIWLSDRAKPSGEFFPGADFFLVFLLALQVFLGLRLGEQWTFRINRYVYSNLKLVREFERNEGKTLYYLNIDDNYYVDFFQFELPERDFTIVGPKDLERIDLTNGYLIVNWNYAELDALNTQFGKYLESDMFRVFYDGS